MLELTGIQSEEDLWRRSLTCRRVRRFESGGVSRTPPRGDAGGGAGEGFTAPRPAGGGEARRGFAGAVVRGAAGEGELPAPGARHASIAAACATMPGGPAGAL